MFLLKFKVFFHQSSCNHLCTIVNALKYNAFKNHLPRVSKRDLQFQLSLK